MSSKPPLHYTQNVIPPRVEWTWPWEVARSELAKICAQLQFAVSDLGGMASYQPDEANGRNTCRFEFHHRLHRPRVDARIGLILEVGKAELKEIRAYATTDQCFEQLGVVPAFTDKQLRELQQRAIELINDAIQRTTGELENVWHVVLYIETPYQAGFENQCRLRNGAFAVHPTRIYAPPTLKRISPVVVTCKAPLKEAARANAVKMLSESCALMTLATGQAYTVAYPAGTKRRPLPQVLIDPASFSEDRFHPLRRTWPVLEKPIESTIQKITWVHEAFEKLSEDDRNTFIQALFAFYAAKGNSSVDGATLTSVSYIAALNALAGELKHKCPGALSCTTCGPLSFTHDLLGDVRAILKLTKNLLSPDKEKMKTVESFLRRAYGEQRSAYVHAATLRHREFGRAAGVPGSAPSETAIVQPIQQYETDLQSLAILSRQVLLRWLGARSGLDLAPEFVQGDVKLFAQFRGGLTVRLPAGRPVVINHQTLEDIQRAN